MFRYVEHVRTALGSMIKERKYLFLTFGSIIAMFFLYAFLLNGQFIWHILGNGNYDLSSKLISVAGLMYGVFLNIDFFSQITMVLIAILTGINVGLFAMKLKKTRTDTTKARGTTVAGVVFGAFAAGCPACATGLLALLGVTGGLSVLPFDGIELKLASIALLVVSLGLVSHSLAECKTCHV